jgi:class 3 adenylate cyclase
MTLPTGTVTFLYTDIEGSTELLGRLGDRYAGVLEEHRRLMRELVERAGGTEIDCRGDEFLFVFAEAGPAVEAAVHAQQALADHAWPEEAKVDVRMGLHSGEPTIQGSSYLGLDVHRVARLASAGHGGQVLMSERTLELSGADVRDLGER